MTVRGHKHHEEEVFLDKTGKIDIGLKFSTISEFPLLKTEHIFADFQREGTVFVLRDKLMI